MDRRNIAKEIEKDVNFINKLKDSIKYLYDNANMYTLYESNNMIVKGLIHESNPKTAYYIIKEDDNYSLYDSIIHSYILEDNMSSEEILSHTFTYKGIDKTKDIDYISANFILKYDKDIFKGNIPLPADIFKMLDKEISDYIKQCRNKTYEKITNDLSSIRNYINMYSEYNNNFVVTDEDLISYAKAAYAIYFPKMPDIAFRFKFIENLKEYNKENNFKYNDLDNYIWNQDGYIILEDQNLIQICKYEDKNNFKIMTIIIDEIPYGISKEDYIAKFINEFDNLNLIEHGILDFKDGELSYINESLYYVFELDIVYGVAAIEEELNVSYLAEDNIDITSVKYLRDYLYTLYDYDRFRFCNQVFLTLGSGYDYVDRKSVV